MLDVAQNAQVPRMTEDVNDRHGRASMKCGKLSQEFAVAEVDGEDHEDETEEGTQETQDGKKHNSDKKDNAASGDWELPSSSGLYEARIRDEVRMKVCMTYVR